MIWISSNFQRHIELPPMNIWFSQVFASTIHKLSVWMLLLFSISITLPILVVVGPLEDSSCKGDGWMVFSRIEVLNAFWMFYERSFCWTKSKLWRSWQFDLDMISQPDLSFAFFSSVSPSFSWQSCHLLNMFFSHVLKWFFDGEDLILLAWLALGGIICNILGSIISFASIFPGSSFSAVSFVCLFFSSSGRIHDCFHFCTLG